MHIGSAVLRSAIGATEDLGVRQAVRFRVVHAVSLSALMAIASPGQAAVGAEEVYRSRNAQGQLVFSDRAPVGPSERVAIKPPPPDTDADRERREAQRAIWQREEAARKERVRAEISERETISVERTKRCSAARLQNAMFGYDGRRYHFDAAGNRIYYSVAEIDSKRSEAKRDMARFCPPSP